MAASGVQKLDQFKIPRKQKHYVLTEHFEKRFETAFEQVVRECADTSRKVMSEGVGQTWITPELMDGLFKLHRMGYAHSYESWMDGKLVGGTFGIQLGGLLTMVSLFHRVSNASSAAAAEPGDDAVAGSGDFGSSISAWCQTSRGFWIAVDAALGV